ncbi:hypothetical protein GCM10027292_29170 [Hydrogenophaga aquatica]
MAIVTVGIDLAKNVFAIHDVDEAGKPALARWGAPVGWRQPWHTVFRPDVTDRGGHGLCPPPPTHMSQSP